MGHEGSIDSGIPWKRCKCTHRVAGIKVEKYCRLNGRDLTHINQINQLEDSSLTASLLPVKGQPATMKLKADAKTMFCRIRKVPLALQDQVKKELAKLESQGIIELAEPSGVTNASPVVMAKKK